MTTRGAADPSRPVTEDLTVASARRRAKIVATFLTEADVVARLGLDQSTLVAWRKAHKLQAVWYAPDKRHLYPPYQFNEGGVIAEVESILRCMQPWLSNDSGWDEVEWFMSPHALLDGQTPAELLPFDSVRVLVAADQEFSESRDARW